MVSLVQKYFIVTGIVIRISSQRRKKWSMAVLAVKITAVWSEIDTFCWRNSFAVRPSTLIKGRKTISTPCFDARS